jgi:hypothetical protein
MWLKEKLKGILVNSSITWVKSSITWSDGKRRKIEKRVKWLIGTIRAKGRRVDLLKGKKVKDCHMSSREWFAKDSLFFIY